MRDMTDYARGAAYLAGDYMPIAEAKIPVTHWGYRRSDVTYDVVGVRDGAFFRLDDHIARFRASMTRLRMTPPETDDEIRAILHRTVALSGLRDAYVAMDCLRASPPPGAPRHPAFAPSYLICTAVPWVWVASEEMIARGMHLMIPKVRRIPPESFDPRVKNFHWGDLTEGQFEALDAGADFAILTDAEDCVTEGAGFNVFMVAGGRVVTPARGALDGVTRASVLELCAEEGIPTEIRAIPADEFRQADEIFGCTTAGGIMPASRIDGRIMGNDRPGPLSERLRQRFWARRAEGWHATPVDYASA
ncbi:aminotransferase class IV [Frigidibacter sp. MR17.24]|uniref:aminotransferase class IV n=1 Tax=Frigidibacter sp. MR17.24 TaxID=3127345 RepID=UPI0030129F79